MDLGVPNIAGVVNKVVKSQDLDQVKETLGDLPLLGALPFDPELRSNSLENKSITLTDNLIESVTSILEQLKIESHTLR